MSIVLRISPAAGSATFGYIYIAEDKPRHPEDAITANFNSAGREVTVLPCPDVDTFMAKYSLLDCHMSFVNGLPQYIVPAVTCILQANQHNNPPNHDWLPAPPDGYHGGPLPSSSSAGRLGPASSPSSTFHHGGGSNSSDYNASYHHIPRPPVPPSSYRHISCTPVQAFFTGGTFGSHGRMSPLTQQGSGSIGGGASTAGPRSMGGTAAGLRSMGGTAILPPSLDVQSILLH